MEEWVEELKPKKKKKKKNLTDKSMKLATNGDDKGDGDIDSAKQLRYFGGNLLSRSQKKREKGEPIKDAAQNDDEDAGNMYGHNGYWTIGK